MTTNTPSTDLGSPPLWRPAVMTVPEEWVTAPDSVAAMRSIEEVRAVLDHARTCLAGLADTRRSRPDVCVSDQTVERYQAAIEALAWLAGEPVPSPVLGLTKSVTGPWHLGGNESPDYGDVDTEHLAVMGELFPRRNAGNARFIPIRPSVEFGRSGRTKTWLHSIELVLDWVRNRDDRNPLAAL
jgi:hypothetical protein